MYTSDYTNTLKELNKDSLHEAGGKGANLGELINAGLPVPPGFVVITGAYRTHLEASNLKKSIEKMLENLKEQDIDAISEASNCISSWIEEAPMPLEVQEEVDRAFESLSKEIGADDNLSVAVRSSATAEDLPSASFAGQHETYLGVYGKEEVFKYVKKCWASLWSPQAIAYRISMNFDHLEVDLAVVVQAMIASQAAGVMFTANPVNGNSDEILISAGYGLGESVVSGLITPDSFILTKEGKVKEKTLGSKEFSIRLTEKGTITEEVPKSKRKLFCLGDDEFMQLANLAKLVEKHYGSPMDTEWALLGGKIYLLQARPITTIISDSENFNILGPEDKIIYQGKKAPFGLQSVMEHSTYPHTPLDFACFSHFYQGIYTSFADAGLKIPKNQNRPVERESGCVALSYQGPGLSPAIMWKGPKLLIKSLFQDNDILWQAFSKEISVWLKKMDNAVRDTKDAVGAVKLIEQALKEYEKLVYKRFSVISIPGGFAEYRFSKLIKKAVGKEKAEEYKESLLRALPFRTALQNKTLMKIAQTEALNGKDSIAFKNELKGFLDEYGDIGAGRMLSPNTWQEKPETIDEIIDALLCNTAVLNPEESFKKQEEDYEAAKEVIKKGLKPAEYDKFIKILEKLRKSVIIREESVFYLEKVAGVLHRMALKLGILLAKQGDILVYTSPIWTPLFKVASAAVTEIGSTTSHAAIVPREYGIPAVVAVENVTNILKDGQKIRVNGTNGIITLLE
ncbi:pyruvate, phosphate dikinase [Clostridium sp. PL3]|uniref:Phosphoenolpyruvate synthase n=2 Tax=Clostridium thailandense TaxID=2794346 RepID=A0A949TUU5_9CLOT|nr:pyruvate, phosphate dikinase [Clostridium thailandense]